MDYRVYFGCVRLGDIIIYIIEDVIIVSSCLPYLREYKSHQSISRASHKLNIILLYKIAGIQVVLCGGLLYCTEVTLQ